MNFILQRFWDRLYPKQSMDIMIQLLLLYTSKLLFGFLIFIVCYSIAAIFLSVIPMNVKYRHKRSGIKIWIISDGIHADFILPATELVHDWWKVLHVEQYNATIEEITHLSFGWGDKGFYMEIPTWNDLTLKIAARAVLIPSPTCMHVTAFKELPVKKYCEPIYLSQREYKQLCNYIFKYFEKDEQGKVIHIPGYHLNDHDNYYEAIGSYHCFNTCNYWVSRGLKRIGVKSPVWSPLAKGIFYQLARVRA